MRFRCTAAIALLCSPAAAQNFTRWLNSAGGLWTDPANWEGADPPNDNSESALFDLNSGAYQALIDGPLTIDTMRVEDELARVAVDGNGYLQIHGLELFNDGVIQVNPNATEELARIRFRDDIVLTGSGAIHMQDATHWARIEAGNDRVTNSSEHTIAGLGEIRAQVENRGLIIADVSLYAGDGPWRTLQMIPRNSINLGVLSAAPDSMLLLSGGTMDQTGGGVIESRGGRIRFFVGGTVIGGSFEGNIRDEIQFYDGTFQLVGVTNNSWLQIDGQAEVVISESFINNGVVTLDPRDRCCDSAITVSGPLTFEGPGAIRVLSGEIGGDPFVNGPEHSIFGAGTIRTDVQNLGSIVAGDLFRPNLHEDRHITDLNIGSVQNDGLIHCKHRNILNIRNGIVEQGPAGVVFSEGYLQLDNSSIQGGVLDTAGDGVIAADVGLNHVPGVENRGRLGIDNRATLVLHADGLLNNGILDINYGGRADGLATLHIAESCQIRGTGEVLMRRQYATMTAEPDATLTLPDGHSIRGGGVIEAAIINEGEIFADKSLPNGGIFWFIGEPKLNHSTIRVGPDAYLIIEDSEILQSPDAQILVEGEFMPEDGAIVRGGIVNTIDNGILIPEDGTTTFDDVEFDGRCRIRPDRMLVGGARLSGEIENEGEIRARKLHQDTPPLHFVDATVDNTAKLITEAGSTMIIERSLIDGGDANVEDGGLLRVQDSVLISVDGRVLGQGRTEYAGVCRLDHARLFDIHHILHGADIEVTGEFIKNEGILVAGRAGTGDVAEIIVNGEQLVGRLDGKGAVLLSEQSSIRAHPSIETIVNEQEHTIAGIGRVVGQVQSVGEISPGFEPVEFGPPIGELTVEGGIEFATTGVCQIDCNATDGSHDRLVVSGSTILDGKLRLRILDGQLVLGDLFEILVADTVQGRFAQVEIFGDLQSLVARPAYLEGAVELRVTCLADLTGSDDPNDPAYGVPDFQVDVRDLFYFLDRFATSSSEADLDGDGDVDQDDFFLYLDWVAAGC